jgi:hypothetical protein
VVAGNGLLSALSKNNNNRFIVGKVFSKLTIPFLLFTGSFRFVPGCKQGHDVLYEALGRTPSLHSAREAIKPDTIRPRGNKFASKQTGPTSTPPNSTGPKGKAKVALQGMICVGADVGFFVGAFVGRFVGALVGALVGAFVGALVCNFRRASTGPCCCSCSCCCRNCGSAATVVDGRDDISTATKKSANIGAIVIRFNLIVKLA